MSAPSTNTVTQSSQPPAQFETALSNLIPQVQQTAATPYQAYQGQQVAPLSNEQWAGIGEVDQAQGAANPYIANASNYISASTNPLWPSTQQFSPGAVSQYESPYTQQVVQSTQQQFGNQNAQEANALTGNAIGSGAYGGDRAAVAQGVAAGQEASAQAPVIAGLENQGYTQALGEFNTQQQAQLGANEANSWLNSQAGYGMANLGNEALNTSLTGANALENVGSIEQQEQQANLNVPYEQFIAQQAYPFQTQSYETGELGNLAAAAGGTGTTSYPGASLGSQLLGGGLAAAGIGNLTGAFGSSGYLTNALGFGGAGAADTADTGSVLSEIGDTGAYDAAEGALESGAGFAGGAGDAGMDLAMAAAGAKRGGRIGGNVVPFPHVRSGLAGRNDNWPYGGELKRAFGGGIGYADAGDVEPAIDVAGLSGLAGQSAPSIGGDPSGLIGPALTALKPSSAPSSTPPNWGRMLLDVGAGIMSGRSPQMGVNIGSGALEGLKLYDTEQQHDTQAALTKAEQQGTQAYRSGSLSLEAKQMVDAAQATQKRLTIEQQTADQQAKHQQGELGIRGQEAALRAQEVANEQQTRQDALTPESIRQFNAIQAMTPEQKAAYQQFRTQDTAKYTYQPTTQPDPDNPAKTISGVLRMPTTGTEPPTFIRTDTDPNKAGAGIGGREGVFTGRVLTAGEEVSKAAGNLMESPFQSSTGWFGGRSQGTGLFSALKESLVNNMTSQSVQTYNSMVPGVTRSLAAIEAQGLAPPGSLTHQMDNVIAKEGDTGLTILHKMAEIRQITEAGLQPILHNPRIPPQQKEEAQDILDHIKSTIPFTHHDVNQLELSGSPTASLAQFAHEKGLPQSGAAPGSGAQGTTPQRGAAQTPTGPLPLPFPASPADAVDGALYQTRHGLGTWNAKTQQFDLVQ